MNIPVSVSLEKKCREYLSSALKGKDIRNHVSEELLRYLWAGNTEHTTDYLLHLDSGMFLALSVKNIRFLPPIRPLDKRKATMRRSTPSIPTPIRM